MKNNTESRKRLRHAAEEILARNQGVQDAIARLDPAGNLSFEEHGTEREFDDVLERLCDRSRRELLQVMGAFQRLENGTYGTCAECGGKIDRNRLKTLPFTEHCIDCAVKLERLEG